MAAADCANYLGLISRQVPSAVSLESARVYMISGCDSAEFPVGSYLVVEDKANPKKRYLAKIAESRIEDIYAVAKTPVLAIEQEVSIELRSAPRLIALDLITECIGDVCGPVSTPVSIHSLVRPPAAGEASKMLGLPSAGIALGDLALPSGAAMRGDVVRLPLDVLKQHVLIVGTTGSGKTTLMKNMAKELVENSKATVVALDGVGHYHHLSLDGVPTRVVYPVTNGLLKRLAKRAGRNASPIRAVAGGLARRYVDFVFKNFGFEVEGVKIKARGRRSKRGDVELRSVELEVRVKGRGAAKIELVPWALRTADVLHKVDRMTGFLTQQARLFYAKVMEEVLRGLGGGSKPGRELIKFAKIYEYLTSPSGSVDRGRTLLNYEAIANKLGIHVGTMENIVRAILALHEMGLFDVEQDAGGARIAVREPDPKSVFEPGYTVVHLEGLAEAQERLIVYRLLDRLYPYMIREHMRDRGRLAVLLIDEAHLFFPQARSEEEKALMETHLTRITRLGRSRGIAVVFATHTPGDLNDVILQLTNTKIIMRSDENVLEKLGVPAADRRFLATAESMLAYVKTYAYRYPVYVKFSPKTTHVG